MFVFSEGVRSSTHWPDCHSKTRPRWAIKSSPPLKLEIVGPLNCQDPMHSVTLCPPFCVYLCGRITAPHTGLAWKPHRFHVYSENAIFTDVYLWTRKKSIGQGKLCLRHHSLFLCNSELRHRLVSPHPAGRPPPVPVHGPSVPVTPLSAPGGPPEKGLSASTPQALIRRPGTPAGTPIPVMGEFHLLIHYLIGWKLC